MKNKLNVLLIVQVLLILILLWLLTYFGRDEFNNATADKNTSGISQSLLKSVNGINFITLSSEIQSNSGIKTLPIQKTIYKKNLTNYATVLNIDLLIEQKNRFNEIKNQINLLTNEFDRDKKNYERFKLLNDDNKIISDKALQEAKVSFENTRIKLYASQELVSGIKQNIRAQWGETILSMIDQGLKKELFEFLLQDKARIVKVTLPENADNEPPRSISLALIDSLNEKFLANYLAESPTLDKSIKGKTYFYIVYSNKLRIDSKVIANLIQDNLSSELGKYLAIPKEAVVWNAGQAWVYIKTGENKFLRKMIETDNEDSNGWIVKEDYIKENDLIVINGAQLLLSEEFKYQIKNENDD
jgi:hypothetical protein